MTFDKKTSVSETCQIQSVADAHFDSWKVLYQGYAKFYEKDLSDEIANTVWSWLLDDTHPYKGLIASIHSEFVGFAHYHAMPNSLRGKDIGFLDDLYVSENIRNAGVGTALLNEVKRQAAHNSWDIVRWITDDYNYNARRLYDKCARKKDWNLYEMRGS